MQNINNKITFLSKYTRDRDKILCKCKICGHEWYQTPNNLIMRKCGCPICAAKKRNDGNTLTHEEFMNKVSKKISPTIEIIGFYKKSNEKILCKCKKCGYEW